MNKFRTALPWRIWTLLIFCLLVLVLKDSLGWFDRSGETDVFEDLSRAVSVKIEYAGDESCAYKVLSDNTEIFSHFFSSLRIIPAEGTFNEEWLMRLSFNWDTELEQITVLVGQSSMSVNGMLYVPEEGVRMSSIIDQLLYKYSYIDRYENKAIG